MELPNTGNRIVDLSFAFALKIVAYTENFEELRKYIISKQLLKVEHPLVQMLEKLKTVKVRRILFINLK